MERLNDYLQKLLSSCSDELHLEPNKNPYLVSENRTSDVGQVPLLGTQISTMVFPIIPSDVKMRLPNSSEIEFVHLGAGRHERGARGADREVERRAGRRPPEERTGNISPSAGDEDRSAHGYSVRPSCQSTKDQLSVS